MIGLINGMMQGVSRDKISKKLGMRVSLKHQCSGY